MPGVKIFAVVHFTEDDSVDVVRSTWLIKVVDDNGYTTTETRWPQQNMAKHVKNGTQPASNWTSHPVRLMTTSDDYLHARKKADEAQFTSNLSSEEQLGEGPTSRKRKPVASWSSSDEGPSPPHQKAPKVRTPFPATAHDEDQDLPRAVPPTKRTVPEIDEDPKPFRHWWKRSGAIDKKDAAPHAK
ncbi:uncharacterized protein [Littorina saxatilis]|uniref:uncharacterized protein n=1 Tax=Littorina saxatilis TaxID=31220 RepID=UPI0038B603AF